MMPLAQDSLSLLVALCLGAAIGLERELSDKAAGLRTNILICVGSCLFAVLSRNLAYAVGTDITRMIAPAPKKPMPDTIWAAMLVMSVPTA